MSADQTTRDRADSALQQVYAATNPAEVAAGYAAWAASYDAETAALGYLLPFLIPAWVTRFVPVDHGPLLDAGCGTGLSGPQLKALGYTEIDGLDISPDMLKIAASRGAYRELKQAVLGENLPWPDGYFRAFFSTGVFTMGHAPASSLLELVRITRKGGHAIFTVRDQVLATGGFRKVFDELSLRGEWSAVEESPWFRCYAVAEPEALVKTFVFSSASEFCSPTCRKNRVSTSWPVFAGGATKNSCIWVQPSLFPCRSLLQTGIPIPILVAEFALKSFVAAPGRNCPKLEMLI